MGQVDLLERTIAFSAELVGFCRKLGVGTDQVISKQLLRAGISIGANIHEAQGGESKADFISKMSIARKEALETLYWFRVLERTDLAPKDVVSKWIDETSQLAKILTAILRTSKSTKQARPSLINNY